MSHQYDGGEENQQLTLAEYLLCNEVAVLANSDRILTGRITSTLAPNPIKHQRSCGIPGYCSCNFQPSVVNLLGLLIFVELASYFRVSFPLTTNAILKKNQLEPHALFPIDLEQMQSTHMALYLSYYIVACQGTPS